MGINLRMEPRTAYLYAEVSGTFERESAQDVSAKILDACSQHGLSKVLVDLRTLSGSLTVIDRWDYSEFMAAEIHNRLNSGKLEKKVYLAYLGDELIDPQKFGQIVATNRGINVKATTDVKDAFRWLGVEMENDVGDKK